MTHKTPKFHSLTYIGKKAGAKVVDIINQYPSHGVTAKFDEENGGGWVLISHPAGKAKAYEEAGYILAWAYGELSREEN